MRTLNLFLLFFFLFALNSYSLLKCKGSDRTKWNNCKGTVSANGAKYVGEWKDGMLHGQGTNWYKNSIDFGMIGYGAFQANMDAGALIVEKG